MSKTKSKASINYEYSFPQIARESGFKLRHYKDGPMDWRLIGSLEVERILRDQNLEQIDNVLMHLSEAPLATILETNILDGSIAKYFLLSQFSIQYLYFCREFLDETVHEIRDSHEEAQLEIAKLKKSLAEANNEILQLHKKMTQMEAIHEVVFPCHWCTKSFVSNDALNIHIHRKHNSKLSAERLSSTPISAAMTKERENDINLINTIKLELEIKKLKERLNVAEKEIHEQGASYQKMNAIKHESCESKTKTMMVNVGIQSNLIESKEKDESVDLDASGDSQRSQELHEFNKNIIDFEEWRKKLEAHNEQSIAEINNKLNEISHALKSVTTANESIAKLSPVMERRVSMSVENLESVLTEKIVEIGMASTKKIEEVVKHLEDDYKKKLHQLEMEIKKGITTVTTTAKVEEHVGKKAQESECIVIQQVAPKASQETPVPKIPKSEAFIIEFNKDDIRQEAIVPKRKLNFEDEISKKKQEETHSPSESEAENNTFVKPVEEQTNEDENSNHDSVDANTSSDVSGSLSSDDDSSEESSDLPKKSKVTTAHPLPKSVDKTHLATKIEKPREKKPKLTQPKVYTRRETKRFADEKLREFGFSMKTRSISNLAFKRVTEVLAEKRNKEKQKHPQLYATRNKFKKFIDQLCSTKMPESAKNLLKGKQPLHPPNTASQNKLASSLSLNENEEDDESVGRSPKENISLQSDNINDAFKKRLEQVLASPMHRPSGYQQNTIKAQLHTIPTTSSSDIAVPVPLPRKRVMFNTQSSTNLNEDKIHKMSQFESSRGERDKRILGSSIDSLL